MAIVMKDAITLAKANDRKIDKTLTVHQRLRDYTLGNLMFNGVPREKASDRGEMWYDNKKTGSGLRRAGFFGVDNPVVPGPADVLTWRMEMLEDQPEMYDLRQLMLNKTPDQIYDIQKQGRARAYQAISESLENYAYDTLDADGQGIMGLREHLRFNTQADGTVAALAVPAANGVRTKSRDTGVVRSTYMGKDRAISEELRSNYTATFANGSAFGRAEANLVRECAVRARFQPGFLLNDDGSVKIAGGIAQQRLEILMGVTRYVNYINYIGTRKADSGANDAAPNQAVELFEAKITQSERLENDPLNPLYAIDKSRLLWKMAGEEYWLKRRGPIAWPKKPLDVIYYDYQLIGQLTCEGGDTMRLGFTICNPGTLVI